jgi:hypothetical protein
MIPPLTPPAVLFKGRSWSPGEMTSQAAGWRGYIVRTLVPPPSLVAIPLANRPDSVALFLALSAGSSVVMVLSEDPRTWRTAPPIPAHTPLILTPEQREKFDAMEKTRRKVPGGPGEPGFGPRRHPGPPPEGDSQK